MQALGSESEVHKAYSAAIRRFGSVLDELCGELLLLKMPVGSASTIPVGTVARRMFHAVFPYSERFFITPMAAVAGAVAEEILASVTEVSELSRAYVNDGGDIALHMGAGQSFRVGMVDSGEQPSLFGTLSVGCQQPVRGIATSGWRGRSFSLGIADAVTVLARTASMADAAATVIANAVDLPQHPALVRRAACELSPDSDLQDQMVTVDVGLLPGQDIDEALGYGASCANNLINAGLIEAAALNLQGVTRVVSRTGSIVSDAIYERGLIHA